MVNTEFLNQIPIDAAAVFISLLRLTGLLIADYTYLQCISVYVLLFSLQAPWC